MTDLVKRLRDLVGQHIGDADIDDELSDAADRIEKLEEEIGVLFSANVWLNSRADLDSDGYVGRIEKLEAALREIIDIHPFKDPEGDVSVKSLVDLVFHINLNARKALEEKND